MRILALAVLVLTGCSDREALTGIAPAIHLGSQQSEALYEVHVCVDRDAGRDCVTFTSDEPASDTPSPEMQRWIENAIAGTPAQMGQPAAADFGNHGLAPEPTRLRQPVQGNFGDDGKALYSCQCATAMYGQHKTFLGCTLVGCDGCIVCVRR